MGKAAKSKREEKAEVKPAKGEEGYEFKLPAFNEQAFIRREMLTARASFYTLALGLLAGAAAVAVEVLPFPWYVGWVPIFAALVGTRPLLAALKFPEEVTSWKALLGSYFMIFFTALAVWILGVNIL
ncbi:MAG TPA: hypothetical protein VFH78_16165 [Candidatus Thermoplasmatota archaeon]|nr:hypothetical protein [Candidatus Thermoplasmatota archaeon]